MELKSVKDGHEPGNKIQVSLLAVEYRSYQNETVYKSSFLRNKR